MTNYGQTGLVHNSFISRNNIHIKQFINIRLSKDKVFKQIFKLFYTTEDIKIDNDITASIVNVILGAIGRCLVTIGNTESIKIITDSVRLSIYHDLDNRRLLGMLDFTELENVVLEMIIYDIIEEFNSDVRKAIGEVSYIEDMFTLSHEEYSESDFIFFKLDDNNTITIIKI